ncbi:MAG TPA: arginine--tRNA ligase, partial [Dehalococcoidia bacterium]|nr:arginine--tRNA ligase [Dehalococcoidia bacterium]
MDAHQRIRALLERALQRARVDGIVPPEATAPITLEHPANPEHGDFATNVALRLAKSARRSPLDLAGDLVRRMEEDRPDLVDRIAVARPGFINFYLRDAWVAQQVAGIRAAGEKYGAVDIGAGESLQVEYVSGNPTGPLHVGHGRGAVLGSTLANVLGAAGYRVAQEYYINDAGNQIDLFHQTIWARYRQALGEPAEVPAEGYAGAYVVELARDLVEEYGDRFRHQPEETAMAELGAIAMSRMLDEIRETLALLGVEFDVWFSERSLFTGGTYNDTIARLRARGVVEERDGALWLLSTRLGEDKDNVLVRNTGVPTYFASDIAYHFDKLALRSFDRAIDIWGADHLGHVSRLKSALGALDIDPDRFTVIIAQMVTLKRGGEVVKLSKRTGEIISLREVVEEVGADACRFFFLTRSADSQMDFDLELAKEQSPENPVYYVQYAHARICSILRLAAEQGIQVAEGPLDRIEHASELTLLRRML